MGKDMIKISVSMIVRNECSCIAKALNSVSDADEIIVCDTGCTDDTVEIARNYVEKVEQLEKILKENGITQD